MATFEVKPDKLKKQAASIGKVSSALKTQGEEIINVKNNVKLSSGSDELVKRQLNILYESVVKYSSYIGTMGTKLEEIADLYISTETSVSGGTPVKGQINPLDQYAWAQPVVPDSLIKKELTKKGILWGIGISGTFTEELFGHSVDKKLTSGIGWKEDEETGKMKLDSISLIKGEISGEGHVAKGSVEGNIGVVSGEASVTAGVISGSGSVGISLYDDGEFAPVVEAGAEVKVKGIDEKVGVKIGNDEYDGHVGAEATVGSAKAGADAGIGKVSYKNSKGKEIKGYGAKAKVKAEAYAAEGSVSGGVKIMGIEITGSIGGKAGGGGIGAEGGISTGGIGGSITAGVLLGAEIGLDIDWSGFKMPKFKLPKISGGW